MAEVGQVVGAQGARSGEVVVDAGDAGGVVGQADEGGGDVLGAQDRDAVVLQPDVHQDDAVGESGGGDAADAFGAFVVGEQQDVVTVFAGRHGDGDGDLHHGGHVHLGVERYHQGDDV